MPLSMYQASVPVFIRFFANLTAILEKAERHAEAKKIDQSVFMNARLAADMLPLTTQIQIASDAVKGCAARLAGVEVPSFPDTEANLGELKERIAKTVAFLQTLTPAQIDGSEGKDIIIKLPKRELQFTGQDYLLNFAMPNFYFHVTTAYAILRHLGVELGKMDFLGG